MENGADCIRLGPEENWWHFILFSDIVKQLKEKWWGKPHPTLSSLRKQGSNSVNG